MSDETPPANDVVFNTEVVKLLLQVAWADDVVAAREKRSKSVV